MATKYKVVAPYVTLKVRDLAGGTVLTGYYAGATLEADQVDEDSLQHHLDGGLMVEEGDKLAETFAVPAGTPLPGQPPNVAVTETGTTAQPVPPLSDEQLELADGRSRSRGAQSRKADTRQADAKADAKSTEAKG